MYLEDKSSFNFTIEHMEVKNTIVPDVLSRSIEDSVSVVEVLPSIGLNSNMFDEPKTLS